MKITEVRKLYAKDPHIIYGVVAPEKTGYVSHTELEARQVPKSYSLRARIVSLQKYYFDYWGNGRTTYPSLPQAQSKLATAPDSEKSFAYLCELYDDQNKPTGQYRLFSSRNTFIGEITPELEDYWLNEDAHRIEYEAEIGRRQEIMRSAEKMAESKAQQLLRAITQSTTEVLTEAGIKTPRIDTYFRGDVEMANNKDWRNTAIPFERDDLIIGVRGEVKMDYLEFQRLIEIVYEAKAKL
jgi:hypothetical protein